ncbi:MFS transporter [Ktedonospora formicarum]|uniref:MFS transporter n=1 Tax=Ktedonospora formicarum TaxID=2778364 RepID=A0A8J3IAL5_9CHLR|nr:MFS transporter [Ktedonospora formicarum]GHO47784.1 MFS transporter [Ktedonospora formicarum]
MQQKTSDRIPRKINTNFWKYWTGQTISNLGSSVTLFALPLLVYKITGSALNLGIASAVTMLPYLLFGLLLGAWADRVDRKRMMIWVDIGRAAIIASIPMAARLGWLSVWWIYLVGFLHSTLTISFTSGEFAAIPNLVDQDDLVTANGRIQASYSAASILGPVLAGVLVTFVPLVSLMLLDSLSFMLSALSFAFITISFNASKDEQAEHKHIFQDVSEGLRYVWRHPVLRNISLMMALVNFVEATQNAQLVLFAKDRFHASDTQVGLFYTAGSIGIVVLSLLAGVLRTRWSFSKVALSALMLMGLFTLILSFTPWYWLALFIQALAQGLGILFNINTGSLRQAIVPNQLLGRVMSIATFLAWSAIPLGSLLGGFIISLTGNVTLVYAGIGILVMLIPFGFSFTPLGHAERYLPQKDEKQQEVPALDME